ncbi:MAG TPA: DinB family protein [Bryobacteraceae bacterium]|nr:DinB family protein [Bryobacteraceae bacterium]
MRTRTRLLVWLCCAPALLGAQDRLKTTVSQRYFNGIRTNLEAAADAMPAAKYGFKLTDGQMSFAEWINHSTERNYADCATLKGEAAPAAAGKVAGLKEKAEVSQALKDSFAYCAAALGAIDDEKVLASPQMTYSLLHIVVHNNEIYGNIVGYLRVNGIVPPSTASRMGRKGK